MNCTVEKPEKADEDYVEKLNKFVRKFKKLKRSSFQENVQCLPKVTKLYTETISSNVQMILDEFQYVKNKGNNPHLEEPEQIIEAIS